VMPAGRARIIRKLSRFDLLWSCRAGTGPIDFRLCPIHDLATMPPNPGSK
jgi:hypothetical protein